MSETSDSTTFTQAAARARIDEMQASTAQQAKHAAREVWALGDYHRFAKETVWPVGEVLVKACAVAPGQLVLDVAAGTGNVAIRAALAGADVVACDLTPANFEAGRREAAQHGVSVRWVEGDAEALPFEDGAFDVVTSCFGAMFAPDHRRVAAELLRVCRPGGTVGLASFAPDGVAGEFFGLFGMYGPPLPPGADPPLLWGSEEHVRDLLGGGAELTLARREYIERAPSPEAYVELFQESFGPMVALRNALGERAAELDRDFLAFATRSNRGAPDGPAEYPYGYLLVLARKRDA